MGTSASLPHNAKWTASSRSPESGSRQQHPGTLNRTPNHSLTQVTYDCFYFGDFRHDSYNETAAPASLQNLAMRQGYLFLSAILPQFVKPQVPQLPQYVLLALTFTAIDGLVMLAYAGSGERAVRLFRTPMTMVWINRLRGGAIVVLAGALALYRRSDD